MAADTIPSVKDLASSDPKLRSAAFKTIQNDLPKRQSITHTQALQIWKGLFYLLYLTPSHPPLPQQRLITSVASLTSLSTVPSTTTLIPLTNAFWDTMTREWSAIDSHRMDKYLLLIRMVMRCMMQNIVSTNASSAITEVSGVGKDMLDILAKWPLVTPETESTRYAQVSEGLRYHVLDCWVDEIEVAMDSSTHKTTSNEPGDEDDQSSGEIGVAIIEAMMQPVKDLSVGKGVSKGVRKRAKDTIGDERWEEWMGRR